MANKDMNWIDNFTSSRTLRFLLYVLIFFQPFNHFNSFREISFYSLLMLLVIKLVKRELKIEFNDKTIIALSLLAVWSFLVSISGPYPLESLNAIRKNLMKEVVIFIVITSEFRNFRDIKPLLWIVVSSFAVVTFTSIIENSVKDWDTFYSLRPSMSWREISDYFFAGYASKATFYIPFISAWLFSANDERWKRRLGVITLCLGFILIYIYNSRTAFISVPLAVLISLFFAKRYKLMACLLAVLLFISLIITVDSDRFSKYRTLSDADTYVSDSGLSGRKGLWLVTLNLIKKRPLSGYGYGWKKMAWVVKDSELIEPLKEKYPGAYDYFMRQAHMSYGKINPHNLFLQIAFEIGVAGLALFMLLWFTIAHKLITAIRTSQGSEANNFLKCSIGLIVSYVIINLTNGFWQESYGNMIFLFMAIVVVLHREQINKTFKI